MLLGFKFCWVQKVFLCHVCTFAGFKFCWIQVGCRSEIVSIEFCWIQVLLDSTFAGFNFCWTQLFAGCILLTAITSAVHGAVFHNSHHFSNAWNCLGWLPLMTAIILSTSLGSIAHDFCTLILLDFSFGPPYTAHLGNNPLQHFLYQTVFLAFGMSGV